MHSQSTTIRDPKNGEHLKTFTFDLAYWSHDGYQKDKDGILIPSNPNSKFAGQVSRLETSVVDFVFCVFFSDAL